MHGLAPDTQRDHRFAADTLRGLDLVEPAAHGVIVEGEDFLAGAHVADHRGPGRPRALGARLRQVAVAELGRMDPGQLGELDEVRVVRQCPVLPARDVGLVDPGQLGEVRL